MALLGQSGKEIKQGLSFSEYVIGAHLPAIVPLLFLHVCEDKPFMSRSPGWEKLGQGIIWVPRPAILPLCSFVCGDYFFIMQVNNIKLYFADLKEAYVAVPVFALSFNPNRAKVASELSSAEGVKKKVF